MARETGTIVIYESLFDFGKIVRDINKEVIEFSVSNIEFAETDERYFSEIKIGQRVSFDIENNFGVHVKLED